MPKRKINKNFVAIRRAAIDQQYDDKGELVSGHRGVVMEGSSRSGKTWSAIDAFIYIATRLNPEKSTLNIVRETYNSFKYTLYDDLDRRLRDFGLYSPFGQKRDVDWFYIHQMKVNLLGADKPSKIHGAGSDYVWLNEAMHIPQEIFDQSEMRCRKFWVMDYNPSLTQHWVFDKVLSRPDVLHVHSTFLDNPYISPQERAKILSYDPENPANIEAGTADDYNWKVYGLGERGEMEGKIFRNINWIDEFPPEAKEAYWYGLDFGFTVDPTVPVRFAEVGNDLYIEYLFYAPIETPQLLSDTLDAIGVERWLPIIADSSDRYASDRGAVEMVSGLQQLGWNIKKVSKRKTVMYWLNLMKERRLHIVKNPNAVKEFENYRLRQIAGITVNQPVDELNHGIDAARYAFMEGRSGYQVF
jgi:PBSX family phage terminase large subunit